MIESLLAWDYELFARLYRSEGGPGEFIMQLLSHKTVWIPLYLIIIQQTLAKYGRKAWLPILVMIALALLADQLTSSWMKPYFGRYRPCHDPLLEFLDFSRRCGGQYGFASSHAANTMTLAVIVNFLFRSRWAVLLAVWALAVSYSRVFLGVHFPLDVLAGMGVGASLASAAWLSIRRLLQAEFASLK